MAEFSAGSKERLDTADVRLQRVFNIVIVDFDCTVMCGYRSKQQQNMAYKNGHSKLKWPKSKHNKMPSEAVDVAPYPIVWPQEENETYEKDLALWYLFAGYVKGVGLGMGIPIKWGGDWDSDWIIKDQNFDDLPHFEVGKGENSHEN